VSDFSISRFFRQKKRKSNFTYVNLENFMNPANAHAPGECGLVESTTKQLNITVESAHEWSNVYAHVQRCRRQRAVLAQRQAAHEITVRLCARERTRVF
jgi:hypothetical protein